MARKLVNYSRRLESDAAVRLVRMAGEYQSLITLEAGGKQVNAKSLMGVMAMGAEKSAQILVSAKGKDEEKALQAICTYLENGL